MQSRMVYQQPIRVEQSVPDSTSDAALIRLYVREADESAFVRLVNRHLPSLRRLLYGLLNGNRDDMPDVEQEVLAALCRELPRFRSDSSFDTYLYRFAKNKAVDFVRKQARERRLLDAIGERSVSAEEAHEKWICAIEHRFSVAAILEKLTVEERLLLTLRELEGLTVREIAGRLALAEGTVKSRLHRTRRKIASLSGGEA